jgi:hypothetical protein
MDQDWRVYSQEKAWMIPAVPLEELRSVNISDQNTKTGVSNLSELNSSAESSPGYDESIFDHMEEIIVTSVPTPAPSRVPSTSLAGQQPPPSPANTLQTAAVTALPRGNLPVEPLLERAEEKIDFPAPSTQTGADSALARSEYPSITPQSSSSVWDNPYLPSSQRSNRGVDPEDLVVKPGEEVYIQLTGQGWTNTTERNPEAFSLWMGLGGQDSQFILQAKTPGEYLLDFNQQDPLTGNTNNRQFLLRILGDGQSLRENTVLESEHDLSLDQIHGLIRYGKWQEAKDELMVHLDSRNPEAQYLAGLVHEKLGESTAARSMYRRALTFPAGRPYVEKARKALFRHYLNRSDFRALSSLVQEWPQGVSPPAEEDYLRALEQLINRSGMNLISDWTGRYGLWYPSPQKEDNFLFLYASMLEQPGDQRDLKLALSLYQKLLDEYVLSPYYSEARKRINYIQQNFMYYR